MQILAWTLVVLLLVAIAVLVRIGRRLEARRTEAAREELALHARRVAELEEGHASLLGSRATVHARELALLHERLAAAVADAEEAHGRFATTWEGEAVSHALIASSCAAADLPGLLATNVVFVVTEDERRFMAQIDHVLVTPRGALIIENKHWAGVVFDGRRPSSVHPSFGALLQLPEGAETSAVQVRLDPQRGTLVVRTHVGSKAPVKQVRIQSERLRAHLVREVGSAPWFQTVVLYSHADVILHAAAEQRPASSRVPTHVVRGASGLTAVLEGLQTGRGSTVEESLIERLERLFSHNGAHVERVGPARTS
ncbi:MULTISPECIES: nuclease-related domain-containing protein [Clavibacter]|uniref:NERD domain-containing protein n=2 Tax=Clavibacter TaxID=1573 RepID=A0A399NWF2_9MICO|nr:MULTISPECIES: nuclease-related domain-containing protein [Clavibacter]KDP90765.1 hypothetical protein W824_12450 [Clavibacter cf. michiganensis LMG 26808]RII98532.1 NERD domain-containing protein [Clavibacter michiganensis]UKF23644.1 NERD domain-containing protein [Clavibacter sp. A6099]